LTCAALFFRSDDAGEHQCQQDTGDQQDEAQQQTAPQLAALLSVAAAGAFHQMEAAQNGDNGLIQENGEGGVHAGLVADAVANEFVLVAQKDIFVCPSCNDQCPFYKDIVITMMEEMPSS